MANPSFLSFVLCVISVARLVFGGAVLAAEMQIPPPADKGSVENGGKFVPVSPAPAKPALSREDAEAMLRKDLKIERLADGKLRIGGVTLDPVARTARFQASVNMVAGPIEYVLVTEAGKKHESVFLTSATPRDIHLAMLLLGVKPDAGNAAPDGKIAVPARAAVTATVEWETNGPVAKHPLAETVSLTGNDPEEPTSRTVADGAWLYSGSAFDGNGFRAAREGNIIALIGDEAALLNNAGEDHRNDDIHVPNKKLLPRLGAPVTVVLGLAGKRPDTAPKAENSAK